MANENDRSRFNRFTEQARKVLSLSQEEAQRLQHNYIGTEHLLLGLVHESEGIAADVLRRFRVDLNRARSSVEEIVGRGEQAVSGPIGLTPRSKKVIELAVDEARQLKHHYIGTEHLLLGLIREGEGIGAGVLEGLGANLDKVRAQTLRILSASGSAAVPPVPAEAASLVQEGEPELLCSTCGARSPHYFRYCFHCGNQLHPEG